MLAPDPEWTFSLRAEMGAATISITCIGRELAPSEREAHRPLIAKRIAV
jgi:hypothetical protein